MQTPADQQYVVVCNSCGRSFAGSAPRQADGCSASVEGDRVVVAPGSALGAAGAFAIQRDLAPASLHDGVVCDNCLRALERSGALTEVPEIVRRKRASG